MGDNFAPAPFDSTAPTPRISQENHLAMPAVEDTAPGTAVDAEKIQSTKDHDDVEDQDPEKNAVKDAPQPEKTPASYNNNLVEWDGPDDPENPHNMPLWRKWLLTMTMSSMTMWMTFASSVFSTATMVTSQEFHVSTEVMTLATSLVVFGFALGPLVWSPLSELYGRRLPLFFGYAVFAIFQIPVAVAQNVQTIMVCRFLIGVFGCSPVAVVGGAMADFWGPIDRAIAIACFSAATLVGPALGRFSVFALRGSFFSDCFQDPLLVDLSPIRISVGDGRLGSP